MAVFGKARGERKGGDRIGNPDEATQDALPPVIICHPNTDRPALYVNRSFTVRIDGWTEAESKSLLEFLYDHAANPEFTCRFRWEKGSIAMWDNRVTWHRALNDYPGQRRYMHRITIEGVPLEGFAVLYPYIWVGKYGYMDKFYGMKTTLDISDGLLTKAKRLAREQNATLRSLVEEGLRKVIDERSRRKPHRVRPVTFKGNGLSKEYEGATWERIREATYEGRGS